MLIDPLPVAALSAGAEADILRKAIASTPGAPHLRARLARLLNAADAFGETIALLTAPGSGALDRDGAVALARACFARDAPGDAERAGAAITQALPLARDDAERARLLVDSARLQRRLGTPEATAALAAEALALDPRNMGAFATLTIPLLRAGNAEAVLRLADDLHAKGVAHTRLFAARALALAALGRSTEARQIVDLPAFLYGQTIAPPPGWPSLAEFNAALVAELVAAPDRRHNRHGTASLKTWRIDALEGAATPAIRGLLTAIAGIAERHVASLAGTEHPWLAARPARAVLKSWCVVTDGEGHEQWHMHPDGWLSGGYYPEVPATVAASDGVGGTLAFGLPGGLIGQDAADAVGEVRVRPKPGMLTMFPSHAHHRTYPHGDGGCRICIAFDICPA